MSLEGFVASIVVVIEV